MPSPPGSPPRPGAPGGARRPTVLFAARLLPEAAVGGQERLSALVRAVLAAEFPLVDLANHGPKRRQWDYMATLAGRLRRAARRVEAPVVDASDGSLAVPAVRSGVPSVMRANGKDVMWANPVYRAVCRRYFPRLDAVVANSAATAGHAVARGARPESVHVVFPPAVAPAGWKREPSPGSILVAARLVPIKGVVEFVEDVWPRVASRSRRATLDIAGDGPLMPQLREAVARGGHGDRVRVHGMLGREALDGLYRKAAVLAVPSRPMAWGAEGFGMVCVEAAMRGVPTVAYAVGGLPDAVVDGTTGWLLPDLDADRAADALVEAIEGPGLDAARMRAEAERRWGMARFRRQYSAVHLQVAEARYGSDNP